MDHLNLKQATIDLIKTKNETIATLKYIYDEDQVLIGSLERDLSKAIKEGRSLKAQVFFQWIIIVSLLIIITVCLI